MFVNDNPTFEIIGKWRDPKSIHIFNLYKTEKQKYTLQIFKNNDLIDNIGFLTLVDAVGYAHYQSLFIKDLERIF